MRSMALVLTMVVMSLGLAACTLQELTEQEIGEEIRDIIRQEVATALTELGEGPSGEVSPSSTDDNLKALIDEAITGLLSEQGLQGEQGSQGEQGPPGTPGTSGDGELLQTLESDLATLQETVSSLVSSLEEADKHLEAELDFIHADLDQLWSRIP